MEVVTTVSVAVIAVVMIVFGFAGTLAALRIRSAAREVERLAESARLQVAPVSHDLTVISQEARRILETVRSQVDKVDDGVAALRDTALRIRDFEQELERRVTAPLMEAVAVINAVARGVEAFYRVLRKS